MMCKKEKLKVEFDMEEGVHGVYLVYDWDTIILAEHRNKVKALTKAKKKLLKAFNTVADELFKEERDGI